MATRISALEMYVKTIPIATLPRKDRLYTQIMNQIEKCVKDGYYDVYLRIDNPYASIVDMLNEDGYKVEYDTGFDTYAIFKISWMNPNF